MAVSSEQGAVMQAVREKRQPLDVTLYPVNDQGDPSYDREMERLQEELTRVASALTEAKRTAFSARGKFIRNAENHRQAYVNLAGLTQRYDGGQVESRGMHCDPDSPIDLPSGTYEGIIESGIPLEGQPCDIYEGSVITTTIRQGGNTLKTSAYVDRNGIKHQVQDDAHVGTGCGVIEVTPAVYTAIPDGAPLERMPDCREPVESSEVRALRLRAEGILARMTELHERIGEAEEQAEAQGGILRADIDAASTSFGEALGAQAASNRGLEAALQRSATAIGQQESSRLTMMSDRAHYLVWVAVTLLCIALTVRYIGGGSDNALTSGVIIVGCIAAIWAGAKYLSARYFR